MGFFNKLFGQSDKSSGQEETGPQQQDLTPCKSDRELIERYGAIALEKQLDLEDVIGENSWSVNMDKGEISFGPDLDFPLQVLGTFSHSSQTWLWAWANTQSGLADNILQHALQLQKYGEENGIDLLTTSKFDATMDDLHLIGLVASGMFNASGYYIADYGQGVMAVTIKSNKVDSLRKENHHRILTVFPQIISWFDMNNKHALSSYLTMKGYAVTSSGNSLSATKNGKIISATFDNEGRLTELNG